MSTPQGDAMAPWAFLLALKIAGEQFHQLQLQGPAIQALFVDDRQAVCHHPEDVCTVQRYWERCCQRLGLRESIDKQKIVANHQRHEQKLLDRVPPELVHKQCRVLGVDFRQNGQDCGHTFEKRMDAGMKTLSRVALLPLAANRLAQLIRTRVVPVLAWGRWLQPVGLELSRKIGSHIKRVVQAHHSGARDLWELLQGHWTCLWLVQLQDAFATLARALSYWRVQRVVFHGKVLFQRVTEGLARLGYQHIAGQGFVHGNLPAINWPPLVGQLGHAVHQLRTAWRTQRFYAFLAKHRRDSQILREQHVQYHEDVCKRARILYSSSSQSVKGSLVGATYSSACYARMRQEEVVPECSNLEHLVWRCEHFAASRPPIPQDGMARRLAWPWRGATNRQVAAVAEHFEQVGKATTARDAFFSLRADSGAAA